jgi:hypothetical protein
MHIRRSKPLLVSVIPVLLSCSSGPGPSEDAGGEEDVLDIVELPPHDVIPDADCGAGPGILSISGDVAPGSTLTITGCTFGTKDPAAPLMWDRVDNRPEYTGIEHGALVPTGAGLPWAENGEHTWVNNVKFYQGEQSHTPGGWSYWIPSTEDPKGKGYLVGHELDLPDESDLYVSWWYRVDNCTPALHSTTKMLSIWPDTLGTNGYMFWAFTEWMITDIWNETESTFSSVHMTRWQGNEPCDDAWYHYEAIFIGGGTTDNGIQGTATMLRDRTVRCAAAIGGDPILCADRHYEAGTALDHIERIGLDISEPERDTVEPTNTWFTEIYIDVTQARVLVGNSAHFSSVSHFEHQIPISWSEDEIQVEVNRGSFAGGDRSWLYVVDADGNPTPDGYPVTW